MTLALSPESSGSRRAGLSRRAWTVDSTYLPLDFRLP